MTPAGPVAVAGSEQLPVLVVDDDQATRSYYTAALRRAGYDVVARASGTEALSTLDVHQMSCVILDLAMPGMDGEGVLRRIRSRPELQLLPVIVVTGTAEVERRVAGLTAGANDYLVKPVDPSELAARVTAHVRTSTSLAAAVGERLQNRHEVVRALADLSPSASATDGAQAVIDVLRWSSPLSAVALYAFPQRSTAVLLAPTADPGEEGTRIGAGLARQLWETALRGPHGVTEPLVRDTLDVGPEDAVFASAIGDPRSPAGLILLAGPWRGLDGYTGVTLAADVSSVVSLLLGPALRSLAEKRASRQEIWAAVHDEATHIALQPVVDIQENVVVGMEALSRFGDGQRPDLRFADARHAGILSEVEMAMIGAALRSASPIPDDVWLALNVSGQVLVADAGLPDLLARANRPVVLELSEAEPIADYQDVQRSLRSMPAGTRLAVDDAGAGYSSLRHVLELRPAFVKLDRQWVTGVDEDLVRQALIEAMVAFTYRSGSQLIAEGVETEAELRTLRALGVQLAQGFLIGHPVRAPGEPLRVCQDRFASLLRAS